MKKQNATLRFLFRGMLIILLLPAFKCAVAEQQTILLDTSGKPLSNEILILLSSSSKKLNKIQADTQKPHKKTQTPAKKHINNPLLERELLHYLKLGEIPRVTQLLKSGVKPSYKNNIGETPLGIAVVRGWGSMVISLVKHGADIDEKGARGVTFLHIASAHGLTDMAKVLVKKGLSPKVRTDKDWTSLHIAARYGHWELVQYYIRLGVNPDVRNTDGKTALGLARHLRHQGVVKILSRVTTVKSISANKNKSRRRYKLSSRKKTQRLDVKIQ